LTPLRSRNYHCKNSGVKHQFSTLKGMKEDVVEFLLNLKKVRISYTGEKPVKASLTVKESGEVKAKDIKLTRWCKISNGELVLATLNKGAKLEAEIEISAGSGYSPAEDRLTVQSDLFLWTHLFLLSEELIIELKKPV